jgi:cysteine sulfinate desulfinase/cysteine desulfurase-like protein
MGRDASAARNGIRMSLGPSTAAADVDRVLDLLPGLVAQVRAGRAA